MSAIFSNKNSGKELYQPSGGEKNFIDEGALLHTLIDNMPDWIYIKDRNSKFVLVNQKVARTHGLRSGKMMLGKSDHDFFPKELADQYYKNEQELFRTGEPLLGHEEKTLDENGEEIYVSATKIPLKDKNGNITGLVGINRDITKRKQAEHKTLETAEELRHINALLEEKQEEIQQQSEELAAQTEHLREAIQHSRKLSAALEQTDSVVALLDADGNLEWVNESFTRIYGQTLDEFTADKGRNILECSHNAHISEIMSRCRESGKTIRYQSETKDKSGKTVWVQSTLTPVFDDEKNIIQFVAIDADITALKTAQDIINKQKDELEERGKLLEKANATKDKFISIIAHDLKNPFNSILGFSDLISKNYRSLEDDKKQEYLSLIHESSLYANNLLDNLLDWSRTQTDRIKFTPSKIELHSTLLEIHRILHSSMEKKNLRFVNAIPANTMAWADSNMIQTVFRNLISNAIKFTPENGTIKVEARHSDGRIILDVIDTGIGIDKEVQKKLFDPAEFFSTSGTKGEQGTGLGLLICHEFIKKHGGELLVESQKGKGTTFIFDIPEEGK